MKTNPGCRLRLYFLAAGLCLLPFSLPIFAGTAGDEGPTKESLNVQEARLHYENAVKAMSAGEFEAAIALFKKSLEVGPNLAVINNFLGIAYLQLDPPRFQDAIESFRKAIDADPSFSESYFNLGTASLQHMNDVDTAKENFKKAIELNPDYAEAYNALGWIYLKASDDVHQALVYLQKAVSLKPDMVMAQYGLGLCYVSVGKRAMAIKPISQLRSLGRPEMAADVEGFMANKSDAESAQKGEGGQQTGMPGALDFMPEQPSRS